ncbi:hypothetical protein AAMO2058_001175400 [Amorphochlora amoebiformis]
MSSSESNVTGNNEAIDLAPALRKLEINEENPSEIPATSPEQARADDSTQTGVFHPADTEGRKQKDLKPGNGIYATKNVLERVAIGGLAVGERADQGGQAVVQSDRKLRSKRNIKRAGRSVASSRVSTVALKTSKLASIQLKPRIRKRQRDKGSRNLKEIITKYASRVKLRIYFVDFYLFLVCVILDFGGGG